MSGKMVEAPVRLALRNEGEFVNAYIAVKGTMEGALFLGSVHHTLMQDPVLWRAWKKLMMDCMAYMMETVFGHRPVKMVERKAPESERSGNA